MYTCTEFGAHAVFLFFVFEGCFASTVLRVGF